MHIILDSNIYAADYRMKGVAFQSLFEYLRRTESRVVLPRAIREEVVIDYGRRLKAGAKAFEDACRKYRHLDLDDHVPVFRTPNGKEAMKDLRRKLMKPMDGVVPVFIPEINGAFLQDVFMRGVHRTRPADDNGEELRDVILWLWTLTYCESAKTDVAFISADGGFWADEAVHPDIDHDIRTKNGRLHIYRSIQHFLKAHAPTPVEVTDEWAQKHLQIQSIEHELIERAARQLNRFRHVISGLSIKEYHFEAGKLYEVSDDARFAELQLQLTFKFVRTRLVQPQPTPFLGSMLGGLVGVGTLADLKAMSAQNPLVGPNQIQDPDPSYLANVNRLLLGPRRVEQAEQPPKAFECKAKANISLRIKHDKTSEVSVDTIEMDLRDLFGIINT